MPRGQVDTSGWAKAANGLVSGLLTISGIPVTKSQTTLATPRTRISAARRARLQRSRTGGCERSWWHSTRRPRACDETLANGVQLTLGCFGVGDATSYLAVFNTIWAMPAATLSPVVPSMLSGCSDIVFVAPPTNTLAPAPTPTAALAVTPP